MHLLTRICISRPRQVQICYENNFGYAVVYVESFPWKYITTTYLHQSTSKWEHNFQYINAVSVSKVTVQHKKASEYYLQLEKNDKGSRHPNKSTNQMNE